MRHPAGATHPARCHFVRVFEENGAGGAGVVVRLQPLNPLFPPVVFPAAAVERRFPAVVVIRRLDGFAWPAEGRTRVKR